MPSSVDVLQTLDALSTWMRKVGAVRAKAGTYELELGPVPAPEAVASASEPESDESLSERQENEALATLLHSSGASVLPFAEMRRRALAKQ